MELSLMVINLTFPILLDKEFLPNNSADIEAYEKVLKLAHDTGYKAVDLLDLDFEIFGVEKVKELLKKYFSYIQFILIGFLIKKKGFQ